MKKHGRLPVYEDYRVSNGLTKYETAQKYLGNIREFYQRYYPQYDMPLRRVKSYSQKDIEQMIGIFIERNQRVPRCKDFTQENGLVTYTTVYKIIGSIREFYKEHYPQYCQSHNNTKYTDDNIDEMIERFVNKNGKLPKSCEFREKNGLPSPSAMTRYFRGIRKYYAEKHPNFPLASNGRKKYSVEHIMSLIDTFVTRHQRLPMVIEYTQEHGLIDARTVKRYLGSIKGFYQKQYPQYYSEYIESIKKYIQRKGLQN